MEIRNLFAVLVVFAAILAMSGVVSADTLVVNKTSPACQSSSPEGLYFTDIQSAVNSANDGDIIIVCSGTYTENIDVDKSVDIRSFSQNPADTIVQSIISDDHVFNVTANRVNISGFAVKGATGSGKAGIKLDSANNCSISNNNATNNSYGIYLDASNDNVITSNDMDSNTDRGIHLFNSNNTQITENILINNGYGLYIASSSSNSIYHNNIINSTTLQAYDNGTNTWDNGYPSGGNYWSNFTIPDDYHGINQDESGFDLLVDCAYSISGGSNNDRWSHAIPDGWMKPLFAPNIILVGFKQNVTKGTINNNIVKYGTQMIDYLKYVNIYVLHINATNQSEFDTLYMFQNDTNVSWATLDVYGNLFGHLTEPNDPCYTKQWHLNNFGVNPGVPTGLIDADIDAPQAWEHRTDCRKDVDGTDFVTAIIDTGVDLNHPDIVNNLWINPNESIGDIANNGIDDDGDGLPDWLEFLDNFDGDPNPGNPDDDNNSIVDDIHGADFSNVSNPDGSPDDENGHGTHCAGIICAEGNNGMGVTGVCWRAKLMVLRSLDADGHYGVYAFTRAINYTLWAKNHGVNIKVVSFSAGWTNPIVSVRNAHQQAIQNLSDKGILFVCAAGNDGRDLDDPANPFDVYPAECSNDNIIAVAASDNQDRLASFSNWGNKSIDIVAPGENILSLAMHGRYIYNDSNGDNNVSAGEKRLSRISAIFPAGSTVRANDGDIGYDLVNFTANETHDGADNVYDTGEHIYRDVDGDNNVSANDVRLTHVYINGTLRYHQHSIVAANDADNGTVLRSFAANEKHDEYRPGNNRYDVGECIYRDADNNNTVSVGDTRLSNVEASHFANTTVQAGDSDVGDCLHSFASNEKFNDSNNNTQYDQGEFIYIDRDNNNTVSKGDQRLTSVYNTTKEYPPGSFVQTGDFDEGNNLTSFTHNEKYSLVTYMSGTSMATPMVTGAVAHFWTLFPELNHTGANSVKYWILRKTDPRPGLADSVVAGEKHNGNFNDGRLRMISGFDFGDAPDPFIATPHKYPTKQDNSQCIGAAHEDIGEEWLGNDTSPEFDADVEFPYDADPDKRPNILPKRKINNTEPPYKKGVTPDLEMYDDGVFLFWPYTGGKQGRLDFVVSTENPFVNDSDRGRYDEFNATKDSKKKIYVNVYFDWNKDGDWDDPKPKEHIVPYRNCSPATWWGGPGMVDCLGNNWTRADGNNKTIRIDFTVPADAKPDPWVRVRLDYGENVGQAPYPIYESISPHFPPGAPLPLWQTRRLAQFGEVEDYPPCIDVKKTVWNPAIAEWDTSRVAKVGDLLLYRCEIHARCCNLTEITVTDILSYSLNYANGATVHYPNGTTAKIEPEVSYYANDNTTLKWFFPGPLNKSETLTITYDAYKVKCHITTNTQYVTAWCDKCNDWVSGTSTVDITTEECIPAMTPFGFVLTLLLLSGLGTIRIRKMRK